jgi:hypothetical protein
MTSRDTKVIPLQKGVTNAELADRTSGVERQSSILLKQSGIDELQFDDVRNVVKAVLEFVEPVPA